MADDRFEVVPAGGGVAPQPRAGMRPMRAGMRPSNVPKATGSNRWEVMPRGGEAAAAPAPRNEPPRSEIPEQAMSPTEQARAKQMGIGGSNAGQANPFGAVGDVVGGAVGQVAHGIAHPLESAEGFASALPAVGGAMEGYRVAKEGMTPEEVQEEYRVTKMFAMKHGASEADADIRAKAAVNALRGHPWEQAVEAGLQKNNQNIIGAASGAALAEMGGPALGKIGGGALGGAGFQGANEYQSGELEKNPKQAATNILATGLYGAGAGALGAGRTKLKEAAKAAGAPPAGGQATLDAFAKQGQAAPATAVPGQPPVAEPPGPRGGPGQPPATPATPPENAVLDKPAIKVKSTSKVVEGAPGENHDQILTRTGQTDKTATRGFKDDKGKWRTRPEARKEIQKQRGVDVGPGSPTSEQLEAEQGIRPPGQGIPTAPVTGGQMVVQVYNNADPSAPPEQHLVTAKGLDKLKAQYKGDPYMRVQARPATPRDVADAMAAKAAMAPGKPGNRIGPNMKAPMPLPPEEPPTPSAPLKANDFSKAAILKRAEAYNFTKGGPLEKGAKGEGPKMTINARDKATGRYLKRKVPASQVAEHVAGLKEQGFPEVAVTAPGFGDRTLQNKSTVPLPNWGDETDIQPDIAPPQHELADTDINALPKVPPPPPPIEVRDMTPTGGGTQALGGAGGMEMRSPTRTPRQIRSAEATRPENIAKWEAKAKELQARGDLGGAMKYVEAANRERMRHASSDAVRTARQAAAPPPTSAFELMQAAVDAEKRGDKMGGQELRNKAALQLARERAGAKPNQNVQPNAMQQQYDSQRMAEAANEKLAAEAAASQKPQPATAQPLAPATPPVPEEQAVANDLENAIKKAPITPPPEPTQSSVPADIPAGGVEAVRDEASNKTYTPANGKTYEYVKNLAAKQPLRYTLGKLKPDGTFSDAKVQGANPQEPVEPAPKGLLGKAADILKQNPKGSVVLPEPIVRAGEQINNLRKAFHTNFGGSFEDIAQMGKEMFRAGMGNANKMLMQVSHAFETMRPAIEQLHPDDRLDMMSRMDTGQPQATPTLQYFADAWHGLNKNMEQQGLRLAARYGLDPKRIMPAFKQFYFPRIFKNAKDGEEMFSMWQNNRPLGGGKEYFKQRAYPTLADAIAGNKLEGRELMSDNPIDILEHTYGEFQKYMAALDTMAQMKESRDAQGRPNMRMFVKNGKPYPQGWVPEPTEFGEVLYHTKKGELAKAGQYYVPEPLGHVMKTHLSPGLWRQGWYRTLRMGTNDMNLLQLGFSGFHVTMTALNSMASDLALSMQKLASGDFKGAAYNATRGTAFPAVGSTIGFWREGHAAEKAFLDGSMGGNLHPMMQAFFDAGGKLKSDREYINGHVQAFKDAVRQGKGLGMRNILRLPFAAAELSGRPLFEGLIPRIKLGVFMEQAAHELKDLDPILDRHEYLKRAQGILDSVDNRFGLINYDNLFWNKTYQNLIHLVTRAPGWYLGTYREYGGAFRDMMHPLETLRGERSGRKMAFALSSVLSTALMSTLYQYASTGTTPHIDPKDPWTSWRNVMHPLSGRKLADGTPERIQWPSYIKDLEELQASNPIPTQVPLIGGKGPSGGFKDYLSSKESPLLSVVGSLMTNADWKNQMIANPDDPRLKQWYDTLKFVGKDNLLPISVQNLARRNELQNAGTVAETSGEKKPWIESVMGLTVPKKRWLETPFRNALYQERLRELPKGPYTPEQIKERGLRNEWASIARRVQDPNQLSQYAQSYMQKGLSINSIRQGLKMAHEDPLEQTLKGSSLKALLANYDKASPDEQRKAILAIGAKMAKAGTSVSPEKYGEYSKQFQHILIEYEKLHRSDPEAVEKAERGEE